MASFFLASTVHCFQRLSKISKGDEEEGNDWWSQKKGKWIIRSMQVSNKKAQQKWEQAGEGENAELNNTGMKMQEQKNL